MEDKQQRNNAASLFGIEKNPSDPQIVTCWTLSTPAALRALLGDLPALGGDGRLAFLSLLDGQWLVSLDGTQYFSPASSTVRAARVRVHQGVSIMPTRPSPGAVAPGEISGDYAGTEFIRPQMGGEKRL